MGLPEPVGRDEITALRAALSKQRPQKGVSF